MIADMPVTLTLKNIPDEVYEALKRAAEENRRSMNSEAILCLERVLRPNRPSVEETLAEIRRFRESLPQVDLAPRDINRMKRKGRSSTRSW